MTVPRRAGLSGLLTLLLLASCVTAPPPPARLTLAPARFDDLAGWNSDHLADTLVAFQKSCAELSKRDDGATLGPASLGLKAGDFRAACAAAAQTATDDSAAHAFFEHYFTPYLAANNDKADGLFTGYYEPLLNGARQRGGDYQTAILKRPPDLVMVDLGRFRPAWRGERIAGRVRSGTLVPYESRAEIENGALDRMHLELLWVDDPVAAFFLQVQGSGRVKLADGSTVRVGYDGQNGQPYVAIGKLLVARGELSQDTVSLQTITAWIKAHPQDGAALMDQNPSYVFFREMSGDGPIGSEGVALTPGRSLAVDRNFIPLGTPLFIVATDNGAALQRLMVAQDTGGAIAGPVRGDVFWGFGPDAELKAGGMHAPGRYYLLLPKDLAVPAVVALRQG